MLILGIGGLIHDGAAALIRDGKLVAAIEEEKLLRAPHPGGLPYRAIAAVLNIAGATGAEVDCVALARPLGVGADSSLYLELRSRFPAARVVIVDHQTAHAAAAYFPSPFDSATALTLDRMGDTRCGALWNASGTRLEADRELFAADSPAAFYSRMTQLLGFRAGAEEHKVQWLSTHGKPRFRDLFLEILAPAEDGLPRVDYSYFDASRPADGGFSEKFLSAIGIRRAADISDQLRADLGASTQSAVESVVLGLIGAGENLCLGGGLALNGLVVQAIERSGQFQNVWVQPAAGNAGTSLGAALNAWHQVYRESGRVRLGALALGPEYDRDTLKQILENCKLRVGFLGTSDAVIDKAVACLKDNQTIAWFQGRVEFGPRALGHRSILASPLNEYSTVNLNHFIKQREPFRKFAASVPEELAGDYFETTPAARYLATVSRVKPEHAKTFETATLGDDLVRVHTVRQDENPIYWRLLHAAGEASGLPVLYNTSFNLFGEPLVADPRAAVRSFYASGIDAAFVGGFLLEK